MAGRYFTINRPIILRPAANEAFLEHEHCTPLSTWRAGAPAPVVGLPGWIGPSIVTVSSRQHLPDPLFSVWRDRTTACSARMDGGCWIVLSGCPCVPCHCRPIDARILPDCFVHVT